MNKVIYGDLVEAAKTSETVKIKFSRIADLERRLAEEEAYKMMKKIIGNSVFVKVNEKRTKIIDGPF